MYENDMTNENGFNEMYGNPAPKKKFPVGAIIGIIVGAIVLIGAVVAVVIMKLQPKSIEITGDEKVYLAVGDIYTVVYEITPGNALNKEVTFSSSDSSVATVDENGRIEAKFDGEAVITVSTKNGLTDEITVVVSELLNEWEWYCALDDDGYLYENLIDCKIEFEKDRYCISYCDGILEGQWEYEETRDDGIKVYYLKYEMVKMIASYEDDMLMFVAGETSFFFKKK